MTDCDAMLAVATAQPITEVELTTWPVWDSSTHHVVGYLDENGRGVDFTRVKCPVCNSAIVCVPCDKCKGQLMKKWHCDRWPTITFKMP